MIKNTLQEQLHEMAVCHRSCFPDSLSSRLGINYVKKTLEWFIVSHNRFLYHWEVESKIVGYCGGFVPQKPGDGSSSGMLQYAFSEAIRGIIIHPWLILHPEVREQYRFLWMNIKRKITGKTIPLNKAGAPTAMPTYVGLVVIGVHPDFRGADIAQRLSDEFEEKAKTYNRHELTLSVKKNNERAINAYKKFGWKILKEQNKVYVMNKFI